MIGPGITRIAPDELAASPAALRVDVFADLVCPWCYVGKKRLDEALLAVRGPSVVNWIPFQLNPQMPAGGMPFEQYLATRYGDPELIRPAMAELTAAAKREGVELRFDLITRVPNTLRAHQLMQHAAAQGADTGALAESLLGAFFGSGLDISDPDLLVSLGSGAGLAETSVLATLDDEKSRSIVLAQEAEARRSGVSGIPDFLVNKRLFVVGAQSTENLVSVFDRAMFGKESDLPVSQVLH